jgi:hypothetical protein
MIRKRETPWQTVSSKPVDADTGISSREDLVAIPGARPGRGRRVACTLARRSPGPHGAGSRKTSGTGRDVASP